MRCGRERFTLVLKHVGNVVYIPMLSTLGVRPLPRGCHASAHNIDNTEQLRDDFLAGTGFCSPLR